MTAAALALLRVLSRLPPSHASPTACSPSGPCTLTLSPLHSDGNGGQVAGLPAAPGATWRQSALRRALEEESQTRVCSTYPGARHCAVLSPCINSLNPRSLPL